MQLDGDAVTALRVGEPGDVLAHRRRVGAAPFACGPHARAGDGDARRGAPLPILGRLSLTDDSFDGAAQTGFRLAAVHALRPHGQRCLVQWTDPLNAEGRCGMVEL
jgi:hypothetical protein